MPELPYTAYRHDIFTGEEHEIDLLVDCDYQPEEREGGYVFVPENIVVNSVEMADKTQPAYWAQLSAKEEREFVKMALELAKETYTGLEDVE